MDNLEINLDNEFKNIDITSSNNNGDNSPMGIDLMMGTSPKKEDVKMDNLNELIISTLKLKKNILKEVKFRPKGNYSLNSGEKFSKKFGNDKLENIKEKDYLTSISESKLVVCY